jgi:hypothetical protein
MAVNGTGDSQFDRVFSQSGMDNKFQSNTIVGVQGQNLGLPPTVAQRAGGILGLQQTYGKKRHIGGKTRRRRRH